MAVNRQADDETTLDDSSDAQPALTAAAKLRLSRKIDEQEIQELCLGAKNGDEDSRAQLWERLLPVARKAAAKYCHKYDWINPDDLSQQMLLVIPSVIERYDPDNSAGNSFSKYAYHRLYFEAKDCLREEDPLGIKWPQKKVYPEWHRLGDEGFENHEIADHRDELDPDDREWQKSLAEYRYWLHGLRLTQRAFPPARPVDVPAEYRVRNRRVRRPVESDGLVWWIADRKMPKQLEFAW